MGFPAARVGDPHVCPMFDGPKPHVGGPVLPPGKPTVLIGGMPAATVGDRCFCASAPDVIIQGSSTVYINNMMAARQFDRTVHGGMILMGCPSVLIGGPAMQIPSKLSALLQSFRDYAEFQLGIVVGFTEGVWETAKSLWEMVTHPIETITGIINLVDNIIDKALDKDTWIALTKKETWTNLKDGIVKIIDEYEKAPPYEKGKMFGRAVEFAAEFAVPLSKAKVAGNAAKVGKGLDTANDLDKVGDAVRAAGGVEKGAAKATTGELVEGAAKKKPSELASDWQGSGQYPGVDKWRDVTLPKGKRVLKGEPGDSGFFVTENALKKAGGKKEALWQGVQVSPHPEKGYRRKVGIYEVVEDTPGAFGRATANPQHGSGGLQQIYIPPENQKLKKIGEIELD